MPGIAYSVAINPQQAIAGLASVRNALGSLGGLVGKLAPLAGIAGGLGIAGAAVVGFKKAIDEAAKMEGFETGFKVLLGNAQAATQRMRELTKFAADTPFELPEIAQASRTLETLTKGALSSGAGLTLVGDVASATQQPFAELATWVGRLYDGLQSGRPVGEAMARLQELGVISGDVRAKVEQLQSQGGKGASAWGLMEGALARFGGMMKEQSATWDGLMSTLQDGINSVFREFGTPILPALKPLLGEGITLTEALAVKAREWGAAMATAITTARGLFANGTLGEAAGLSLKVGFGNAVEFLATQVEEVMKQFSGDSAGLFSGLSKVFKAVGITLSASIKEAIQSALNGVSILGKKLVTDDTLQRTRKNAPHLETVAAKYMQSGFNEMFGAGIGKNLTGFLNGLSADTEEARARLADILANAVPKDFLGPTLAELKGAISSAATTPGMATPDISSPQRVAMSDRLAKIGGFIGGSGGARGEKAQQDTARNTTQLVNLTRTMSDRLGNLKPATSGVF